MLMADWSVRRIGPKNTYIAAMLFFIAGSLVSGGAAANGGGGAGKGRLRQEAQERQDAAVGLAMSAALRLSVRKRCGVGVHSNFFA